MIHQFNAQRFRTWRGRRVGTIPLGTIVYIQDGARPFGALRAPAVRRNPWQVTAWIPREYHERGRTSRMAGGHLATVKSLRDGREQEIADWILLKCIDAGLEVER